MFMPSLILFGALLAASTGETAVSVIAKSVEANDRDWKAAPQYSYTETTKDGSSTKTYEVIMLFGSPYKRLLRVNGEPLSPDETNREQQKLNEETAKRRSESKEDAAKRIADYEKGRRRDSIMMEQLTKAFNFTLTGESKLGGRRVYVLRARPRPDYQPPNMDSRVLTGMKGELWIDQQSFQWVKVVARVISPVTIGGFLATVQPGTYFELEKTPVAGDIWLPKHFKMQSQSKILMLFHHATQEEDTYSDYVKTPQEDVANAGGFRHASE